MGSTKIKFSPSSHTDDGAISKNLEIKARSGNPDLWRDSFSERLDTCGIPTREEDNRMTLDSSTMQMMSPLTKSSTIANSPTMVDQKTADVLRGFFQDMTKTIQALSSRHSIVAQSYADMGSTESLSMPSTAAGVPASQTYSRETNTFQGVSQTYHSAINGVQVSPKHYCQEEKSSLTQDWIPQGWTDELEQQERDNIILDEEKGKEVDANMVETEVQLQGSLSEASLSSPKMDAKTVDALKGFLEDMQKTVEAWSTKHDLFVQESSTAREHAETLDPPILGEQSSSSVVPSTADKESCDGSNPQDLDAVQVVPHPDRGDASLFQSTQPLLGEKKLAHIVPPDHWQLPSDGEVNAIHLPQQDIGRKGVVCEPQLHNGKEALALSQPDGGDMEVVVQSPQPTHAEAAVEQIEMKLDHEEMNVEFTTLNDNGEGDCSLIQQSDNGEVKSCHSPDWIPKIGVVDVATEGTGKEGSIQQVTTQSSQRATTVVESPDWLPKGWITEVKIRGSGNSAGAKDKYYYDPVSNRRFRSKKEVSCFLKTGKLGRYKPRPKIKSVEGTASKDSHTVPRVTRVRKSVSRPIRRASASSSSPKPASNLPNVSNSSALSSISASGLLSNVFVPHWPGQPSEWLVHESLTSLPVSVFEHFPYPDHTITKLNGHRVPPNGQWVSNSDQSWRPSPEKNELCRTIQKGKGKNKDATDSECPEEGGMRASETGQKHAGAGTKKFCKKLSS